MRHFIHPTKLAVVAAMLVCACGSNASNQQITDPGASEQDTAAPIVNTATAETSTSAQSVSPDTEPVSPDNSAPPSDANTVTSDCGGRQCENGQSCIEYYGFAGKPLYTCGIPCIKNAPNDGCPDTMRCVVIPDGPTQCMPR